MQKSNLQISDLRKFSVFFSTKYDGNMSYMYGEKKKVDQNRYAFLSRVGINSKNVHVLKLTHSSNVAVATFDNSNLGFEEGKTDFSRIRVDYESVTL